MYLVPFFSLPHFLKKALPLTSIKSITTIGDIELKIYTILVIPNPSVSESPSKNGR
jgi:hypothetical protein